MSRIQSHYCRGTAGRCNTDNVEKGEEGEGAGFNAHRFIYLQAWRVSVSLASTKHSNSKDKILNAVCVIEEASAEKFTVRSEIHQDSVAYRVKVA